MRALALRLLDASLAVAGRVVAVAALAVAGRVISVARAAHSVAVVNLGGAVEFRLGPAGLVHDGSLLEGAEWVIHADALVVLLRGVRNVEDSVANALLNFVALLNGEADLDGFVLDVLPQLADELSYIEALAVLLVRHHGAAVLVGSVSAPLFVGGAADSVRVRLAELLEDRVEVGRADCLPSVAVVLGVGVCAAAVAIVLVTAGGVAGA